MEKRVNSPLNNATAKTLVPLSIENFMVVYNPILEKILKKLDFHSLLNFARAIFTNERLLMEIDDRFELKEAERWLAAKPAYCGWVCAETIIHLKMGVFDKQELKNLIIGDIRDQPRFKGMACLKVKMSSLLAGEYFISIHSASFLLIRRWEHNDIVDNILKTH